MKKGTLALLALMLSIAAATGVAYAADSLSDINIPYEKFVLPNGLTVIVHEDHKAPIVAVNVWYHVGSKDERPGRTGGRATARDRQQVAQVIPIESVHF